MACQEVAGPPGPVDRLGDRLAALVPAAQMLRCNHFYTHSASVNYWSRASNGFPAGGKGKTWATMLSVTYTKNSSASASQVQLKVLHTHDVTILNCRNRRDSPS